MALFQKNSAWLLPVLLAHTLLPLPAEARIFRTDNLGELQGIFDVELAYGARYRVQDQDRHLIATASGGSNRLNSLLDDGDLNYKKNGFVSNMVRATGELTLRLGNFGTFFRGYAFYDYENDEGDRDRTPLGDRAEDQVAKDTDLLDAYLSARYTFDDMPGNIRVGDQVVTWGESVFFSATGVNVINPLNLPLFFQPTSSVRDLRLPVGLVWASLEITPLLAVEGFYQYSWDATVLPEGGTYLSGSDLVPGVSSGALLGATSDLGTDLCQTFGLAQGDFQENPDNASLPIPGNGVAVIDAPEDGCFDSMLFKAGVGKPKKPEDGGQYGLTFQMIIPELNDTKLALHYANYHSRLPYANLRSVKQSSLDAGKTNLAFNLLNGVDPAVALSLAAGNATKDAELIFEYPEDIQMLGFSFNTTTIHTGTAFSGEIAHFIDHPQQIHLGQFAPSALNIEAPGHPGSEFAPSFESDTEFRGWIRRDMTQASLGITQLLGPQFGASQLAVSLEVAALHIHNMPNKDEFRLQAPGVAMLQYTPQSIHADQNSWGYRLASTIVYTGVLGMFEVTPRVIFAHDVNGNAPLGLPFQEDRQQINLGFKVDYINRVSADFSYTSFFGAGQYNVLNDRDFLNFNLRYNF